MGILGDQTKQFLSALSIRPFSKTVIKGTNAALPGLGPGLCVLVCTRLKLNAMFTPGLVRNVVEAMQSDLLGCRCSNWSLLAWLPLHSDGIMLNLMLLQQLQLIKMACYP